MVAIKSKWNKKIFFDLIIILLVNTVLAFVFVNVDVAEQLFRFSRTYESMQLDEIFPLTVTLLISFIYFSIRRWRDSASSSLLVMEHATKDPLTKLLNRRTLGRKLETEWERFLRYHEDFCVVIFDIDDFSLINDSLGHVEGDRILVDIATMLSNHTRKTDFCARWGEEEFLILCPVCKDAEAVILAEKLRSTLYRTLKDGVELSASFAVAQSDSSASLEKLMKRVELALQKAKQRGKNCVVSG